MESNKKIGTHFERFMCEKLAKDGWWAHFLAPSANGSQPFDIIAIRGSHIMAIDCKTCKSKWFPYDRIEPNQRMAFDILRQKTDSRKVKCGFMIMHDERIIFIPYERVLADERAGRKGCNLEEKI